MCYLACRRFCVRRFTPRLRSTGLKVAEVGHTAGKLATSESAEVSCTAAQLELPFPTVVVTTSMGQMMPNCNERDPP